MEGGRGLGLTGDTGLGREASLTRARPGLSEEEERGSEPVNWLLSAADMLMDTAPAAGSSVRGVGAADRPPPARPAAGLPPEGGAGAWPAVSTRSPVTAGKAEQASRPRAQEEPLSGKAEKCQVQKVPPGRGAGPGDLGRGKARGQGAAKGALSSTASLWGR